MLDENFNAKVRVPFILSFSEDLDLLGVLKANAVIFVKHQMTTFPDHSFQTLAFKVLVKIMSQYLIPHALKVDFLYHHPFKY